MRFQFYCLDVIALAFRILGKNSNQFSAGYRLRGRTDRIQIEEEGKGRTCTAAGVEGAQPPVWKGNGRSWSGRGRLLEYIEPMCIEAHLEAHV